MWSGIFYVDLASFLGNSSFLRQLRTLLEGYPRAPSSTVKRPTAQQFFLMVCISGSYLLDFTVCHLSTFSPHGQINSVIMTCLSDGEYIKMPGGNAVRQIWIGNTYCLVQSVTTFQPFVKNKIPDLLVVLFGFGVPDFTKQIFLFSITWFGMLFINVF